MRLDSLQTQFINNTNSHAIEKPDVTLIIYKRINYVSSNSAAILSRKQDGVQPHM